MSDSRKYEVVIVGGGPAGVSAARTAARMGFRTLVLERLANASETVHSGSGVLNHLPGFISAERYDDGLYYPEVDLRVPASLINGFTPLQRYVSPSGYEFRVPLGSPEDVPVAVVNRRGFQRFLVDQALTAGAELRFGTTVTGLIREDACVVGVRTTDGDVRARVVISAEGATRRLVDEAGLFASSPLRRRYAFVVSQEMEAPAVGDEDLGQIFTFGSRFTSAPESFGTLILPAPGYASVSFTVFTDQSKDYTVQSAWAYLDEYVERDPRVCHLLENARILSRSGYRTLVREAPQEVVTNGFLGAGDAVSTGTHLGILPAILTGRQAALVAAEAIEGENVSAKQLSPYARHGHGPVLQALESQAGLVAGLSGMSDDEADRLCQTLQTLRITTPHLGEWRTMAWELMAWVLRQFPLIVRDWNLLERVLQGSSDGPDALSAPFQTPIPAQPIPAPLRMAAPSSLLRKRALT